MTPKSSASKAGPRPRDASILSEMYLLDGLPPMSRRLVDDFTGKTPYAKLSRAQMAKLKVRATDLGFSTSLESVDEISWPFCEAFASPTPAQYYTHVVHVPSWLRDMATEAGGIVRADANRDPFAAPLMKYQYALPKWYELILSYRKTIVVKKAEGRARLFVPLLEWVMTRSDINDPLSVRRAHIRDDANRSSLTLRRALGERQMGSKSKNAMLNSAASLFDHLALNFPGFKNPIRRREDAFSRELGESSSIGKTYRKRIPLYVLDDIKDFLVERKDGVFRWGTWARQTEIVAIKGDLVFCPIRPAIIMILATFPLRINQVRWLDSGEMDAHLFDFTERKFRANPNGSSGRAMGVIQPASDEEVQDCGTNLDFQVAINKRPIGDRGNYTIPYIDERTLWVIDQVLAWQRRFGRAPLLVREADAPYDMTIAQDAVARGKMPEICPLFRDPRHRGLFPPSYGDMKAFWTTFCAAYDSRNANWTNPVTGKVEERQGWPRLSISVIKERIVCFRRKGGIHRERLMVPKTHHRHDLYSLKVGGVSSLIDRGLPLAIVSAMAGHRTLCMTLRYFVLDRTVMRLKVSEAAKTNPDLRLRPSAIEARLQDTASYADWLRGNSAAALTALQHSVREGNNFTISTTGICPGARCEEGLRLKLVKSDGSARVAAVPGSLCGLCEFRVYGPAFLVGLVKEFNELIYTLTEQAKRQQSLRERHRALEAEGRFDEAIVCRNEDEELTRRAEPDCAHAARIYEMINECVKLAEESVGSAQKSQHTLVSQKQRVRPEITSVGQFEQWKEILEMAELLPSTRSLVPEQVGIRMQNKLMGMLARNGATPFLAVLPERVARKASLEFARIMEQAVPSSPEREEVFLGRLLLREIGKEAESTLLDAAAMLDRKYESLKETDGTPAWPLPKLVSNDGKPFRLAH